MSVRVEHSGVIYTVVLARPDRRNAVDSEVAALLSEAFCNFERDDSARVAVLFGEGGNFCAGADLKAVAEGKLNILEPPTGKPLDDRAPMGPTRLRLTKPVIAAISGYAVAGGLELACWCDLRVVEESATFGVFCRRWGVPLIDGGTVRLPALIGLSRAMDLILTGRPVDAAEALAIGLANRVVPDGKAREAAEALATELAALPQTCLRSDRESALASIHLPTPEALVTEFTLGMATLSSGESASGAMRFRQGAGRGGQSNG